MKLSVACVVVACLSLVTIVAAQQRPSRPPMVLEGATMKIGPHSYVILDEGANGVPNVGIVVGSRATLVIDPGLGRRNGETVMREAAKISANREIYLGSTHYHVEHTTGLVAFPPPARYVNAKVQEEEFTEGAEVMAKRFSGNSPAMAELLRGWTRRAADVTFDRDYMLDLGGVRVRFQVVGPTHTRGDTIFFVEGDNVLYAGDVIMKDSFVAANQDSSMKAWLAAYDLAESMHPTAIVPAHGPMGDGSLIGINRQFMRAIDARTRELKAQGRPVDEVATTVQMEMQALHPTWGRLNGAGGAARGAYAEAP